MSRQKEKHDAMSERGSGGPADGDIDLSAGAMAEDISQFPPEAADAIQQLRAERDDAMAGRLRALADFKNYQRRAVENEGRAASSAKAQMIRSLLPALDQLEIASQQDPSQMTAGQIAAAMNIVQHELLKALQASGLRRIEPNAGDEFNPLEHEAILHQPAGDVAPGHVVTAYQTGYALGDMVLRPAKVIVASHTARE